MLNTIKICGCILCFHIYAHIWNVLGLYELVEWTDHVLISHLLIDLILNWTSTMNKQNRRSRTFAVKMYSVVRMFCMVNTMLTCMRITLRHHHLCKCSTFPFNFAIYGADDDLWNMEKFFLKLYRCLVILAYIGCLWTRYGIFQWIFKPHQIIRKSICIIL